MNKMSRQKKDWAIKTRVDKLFDQITFRSDVVYLSTQVFILFAVCDMCIKDWVYRNFFFVLCLHFCYYIIWNRNVSPRFVRISVFFLIPLMFSYKSFHIKKIFRLYVMRNHTIYIRKESVTIYWYFERKIIHAILDLQHVKYKAW